MSTPAIIFMRSPAEYDVPLSFDAAVEAGLLPGVPAEVGGKFLEFCREQELLFTQRVQQAELKADRINGQVVFTPMLTVDGFCSLARRTGCWLPGKEWFVTDPTWGSICYASCYVSAAADRPLHEVTATARYVDYVERMVSSDLSVAAPIPTGSPWNFIPTELLSRIARLKAAARAMPALARAYRLPFEITEVERHMAIGPRARAWESA